MIRVDETSEASLDQKVLIVSNMYPTLRDPAFGKFVEAQVEALRKLGCQQDVLLIQGKNKFVKYLSGIYAIRKRVRSHSYSHVHAYYGLCGFVAVCQNEVPVIVTYCGSDLNPGFAGRKRARLRSFVIIVLGQLASLRASVCIVRSREMLSRLWWSKARTRAHIITSGLDLHRFTPTGRLEARRRLGWPLEHPVVLFACADAALPAVKRPELAKAVMEEVRHILPEVELKIVAGRPQEELPNHYNAADVLLLTSANEGSPNVVKEALACNLPVVSTRVGDVPELLAGLKNCYVCLPNAVDLASKVIEVLGSRERTNSRDRMKAYSLERTSVAILNAYQGVCSQFESHAGLTSTIEGSVQ
jgi:glycosyltransferase involved in cell wall biosynthesis